MDVSKIKENFENWASDVKILGKPAFDLDSWNDEKEYDDFITSLAFAAWKAAIEA